MYNDAMQQSLDIVSAPDIPRLTETSRRLPETDGVPLESPWHRAAMNLLIEILIFLWRDRNDFYVGGNMFLHYSTRRARNEDFKGPDFFYVKGVERDRPRESWIVWEEGGKYPNLIVEFLSRTTAEADRTTKKDLYEQIFRTPEYFWFDPEANDLQGFRLVNGSYQCVAPDSRGWLWSEQLQLWLGKWSGEYLGQEAVWLRFYDAAGNLVPTRAEAAEAESARLKARLAEHGLSSQP